MFLGILGKSNSLGVALLIEAWLFVSSLLITLVNSTLWGDILATDISELFQYYLNKSRYIKVKNQIEAILFPKFLKS